MNMPTPVDPDKLRARLTQAVEPVKPSPDALIRIKAGTQRRRRLQWTLGSGAGVVAVAGATAAVVAVGSLGHPSASPRTVEPGYSPTTVPVTATTSPAGSSLPPVPAGSTATPAPPAVDSPTLAGGGLPVTSGSSTATSAAPSTTTVPALLGSTAASPTVQTSSSPVTSPASVAPVADDVDHDGKPDTVVVARIGTEAMVVVHLAGRTVTSAPFRLGLGSRAGRVTFISVNRDGRSEILISGLGASAEPYYLFQYANGAVTQVPAPAGLSAPWLVWGGGQNVDLTFGCSASGLVLSRAQPKTLADANMNNASYVYSSATYRFQGSALVKVSASSRTGLLRAEAMALASAQPSDRCGAAL